MVDPVNFTNFELNKNELEEYILFSIGVAGKKALLTAKLLDRLLKAKKRVSPFASIRAYKSESNLRSSMKEIGFGCHTLKARGFWWIANSKIDLQKASVKELEKCPGIGMKTSRFFAMHTRKEQCDVACLDVHILRYMHDQGFKDIPKQTPTGKRYLRIQNLFLDLCSIRGLHPAHFDLQIWNEYRNLK